MHKIRCQGLTIEKFQLLVDDDAPGQVPDMSADMSAIEFSKSFSEVAYSTVALDNIQYQPFEAIAEEPLSPQDDGVDRRIPCGFCGRKFNADVSLKHVPICQKNYEKKHGPVKQRANTLVGPKGKSKLHK